jgi:hypothetical protein
VFWRIWSSFVVGVIFCSAGGLAFYYAHENQPSPGADPMAGRLLSPEAYERWHWGGIALMALGAVALVWMFVLMIRPESRQISR